ncbi:ABC transporter substrate-binding protein [Photobacterium sp. 53610]|uniref:ABC transporter substrate-binding protein n=1 Tax=Photobacterium sp. 53610 TaxID=3102789 RepID=UPI002EDBB765
MPLLGYLRWIAFSLFLFSSTAAFTATMTDSLGKSMTLDTPPQRIVTLEYAFADALAAIGISPVGIADDNDPLNLHPAVISRISGWVSVGDRSSPDLSRIAALKPDLIIADVNRHQAIYPALSAIAPTALLASRGETYAENLDVAEKIGKLVDQEALMTARLQEHDIYMRHIEKQLSPVHGQQALFAVALENGVYAYSGSAYPGGVLKAIGLRVPEQIGLDDRALRLVTLEEISTINPDILLSGTIVPDNALQQWQQQPVWPTLQAVKSEQFYQVDGRYWAHCRGILASEAMADALRKTLPQFTLEATDIQTTTLN